MPLCTHVLTAPDIQPAVDGYGHRGDIYLTLVDTACVPKWITILAYHKQSIRVPVACMRPSFLFTAKQYSVVWMDCLEFTHSPADVRLNCFHCGAIMNNAAMSTHVCVFV